MLKNSLKKLKSPSSRLPPVGATQHPDPRVVIPTFIYDFLRFVNPAYNIYPFHYY